MTTLTPEDLVNKLRLMSTKLNAGGKSIALQAADLIEQQEKFRQSLTPKPIEEAPRDGSSLFAFFEDGKIESCCFKSDDDYNLTMSVLAECAEQPTRFLPLSALTALMKG